MEKSFHKQNITHTKVKLQIDGEMLVHLIVNDVAISYSSVKTLDA